LVTSISGREEWNRLPSRMGGRSGKDDAAIVLPDSHGKDPAGRSAHAAESWGDRPPASRRPCSSPPHWSLPRAD